MNEIMGYSALTALAFMVICVLWIILPFALFGIKPKLDKIIKEAKKTNTLLAALSGADKELQSEIDVSWRCSKCGQWNLNRMESCHKCGHQRKTDEAR